MSNSAAEALLTGSGRRWWMLPLAGTLIYVAAGVTADVAFRVRTAGEADPWGRGTGPLLVVLAVTFLLAVGVVPLVRGWVVAVNGIRGGADALFGVGGVRAGAGGVRGGAGGVRGGAGLLFGGAAVLAVTAPLIVLATGSSVSCC